jgi:hypothetical protein
MSRVLRPDDPLAAAVAEAIRAGDIEELHRTRGAPAARRRRTR